MTSNLSPEDIRRQAARAVEKAEEAFQEHLLAFRFAQGRHLEELSPLLSELYYCHHQGTFEKLMVRLPRDKVAADLLGTAKAQGLIADLRAKQAAYKVAQDAKKSALAITRAKRAEKQAAAKEVLGAKLSAKATKETFQVIHSGIQGLLPILTELYNEQLVRGERRSAAEDASRNRQHFGRSDAYLLATARRCAQDALLGFAAKLTGKIDTAKSDPDKVTAVKLEAGYNPKQESRLTVSLSSGATQVWTTSTIVNRSVYGKLFNQWPTRRAV